LNEKEHVVIPPGLTPDTQAWRISQQHIYRLIGRITLALFIQGKLPNPTLKPLAHISPQSLISRILDRASTEVGSVLKTIAKPLGKIPTRSFGP